MGRVDYPPNSIPESRAHSSLSPLVSIPTNTIGNSNSPDLLGDEPLFLGTPPAPPVEHMEELIALCLLGKIWGDYVPLPAIINTTKHDWKFIRGQVSYLIWVITGFLSNLLTLRIKTWFGRRDLGMLMD